MSFIALKTLAIDNYQFATYDTPPHLYSHQFVRVTTYPNHRRHSRLATTSASFFTSHNPRLSSTKREQNQGCCRARTSHDSLRLTPSALNRSAIIINFVSFRRESDMPASASASVRARSACFSCFPLTVAVFPFGFDTHVPRPLEEENALWG